MALRLITQARLALRSSATTSTAFRAALAQRAALVPLPARTFALSRPWFAAEAAQPLVKPPQSVLVDTHEDVNKDRARYEPAEKEPKPDPVPFLSIKNLVTRETYNAITVKPYKLTHMTPVQSAVLPLLPQLTKHHSEVEQVDGKTPPRDLLVRAKTGTGKTLAYLVPAIEARVAAIDRARREALEKAGLSEDRTYGFRAERAFTRTDAGTLIISPTRELATQIANEALKLTQHHDGFEVRLFVGGNSKREQMRGWMKGRRDIVVATPGRLRDLIHSEPAIAEGLKNTQMLILDEADTLLDMGFRDDLDDIISHLPESPERQTMLYSATVSRAIQQVARAALDKNHLFINTVTDEESPVHAHIPQYHTVLPKASDQLPHILRLLAHDQLSNPGKSKSIIFLPTTRMTQMYAQLLRELSRDTLPAGRGTQVYEIHSKKDQDSRSRTSDRFRKDTTGAAVLVTSDVSARGVDYPGVTRVIQVGIPSTADQYVHRVGRTGRAGTTTTGRGDLVLLPWEIGFVTWQLTHVPMQPTTVKEVEAQLLELASKHDEDPAAFYTPPPVPRHLRTSYRGSLQTPLPVSFSPQTTRKVQEIESNVKELLPQLDSLMVDETFASLLGYYIAKTPELRVAKGVVLQGCKDWATGAGGLLEEPYVSEAFLKKLGYDDGRTKRFGARRVEYQGRRQGAPWSGRGSQRDRDRTEPFFNQRKRSEIRDRDYVPREGRGFGRQEEGGYGARRQREFGPREDREFSPREDRGFSRRDEGGFRRRDEGGFGRREFSGERRARSLDREDEDHGDRPKRRSFNLENPQNAEDFVGTPFGKRPRSEPRL